MGPAPQDHDNPPRNARRRDRIAGRASLSTILASVLALALLAVLAIVVLARSPTPARQLSRSSPRSAYPVSPLPASSGAGQTVNDPIDSRYLTEVPFGKTSFWIQPWRAYLDTWPASRLLNALGVNFNVEPGPAKDVAQLLHDSGFKLARVEIPWDSLSYSDPRAFVNEARIHTRLDALREYGLRPLIVLNANSGDPCPTKRIALDMLAPAPAGARTVTLSPTTAAAIVPGKTGFNSIAFRHPPPRQKHRGETARATLKLTPAQRQARRATRRAAHKAALESGLTPFILEASPDILITKVSANGVATLSRPLPVALSAGVHKGSTLLYAPFGPPRLADGSPNPAFRATLQGWLSYVANVSRLAQSVFGPGGYDLEVWNELGFGSQFLNIDKYYGVGHGGQVTKDVTKALLQETVAYVRNLANGISSQVGVTDGFASQSPFPTGAYSPQGLTALSKHLYANVRSLPASYQVKPGNVPVNALGNRDTVGPAGSAEAFKPLFIPHYQSLFPEYPLTATATETIVRDISPITTKIYSAPHGRNVGPAGGDPVQTWMTEYNLGTAGVTPVGGDEVTPESSVQLTPADRAHFQAKALLRSLVAMVNKGMSREYFYAAAHVGELSLIGEAFFSELKSHPGAYPGDGIGGETMRSFRNMLSLFHGPGPAGAARQLTLLSIAQDGNHAQFTGDGSAAHPTLYDRDVLAVLPFQASPTRFEIPIYVMTRDLLTLYEPNQPAGDIARFDLPDETFRISLGNLPPTANPPTISAYDPLRNESTPARIVSQTGATATIEIAATDYPRILTIDYAPRSHAHQ